KYPIPTRYIRPVAPVVSGTVLSGQGTTSVVLDAIDYGSVRVGDTIMFENPTPASGEGDNVEIEVTAVTTAFDEDLLTETVTLESACPSDCNSTRFCVV